MEVFSLKNTARFFYAQEFMLLAGIMFMPEIVCEYYYGIASRDALLQRR